MVSSAVMVKLHELVLPLPSSAVMVTNSESPSPLSFVPNATDCDNRIHRHNYPLPLPGNVNRQLNIHNSNPNKR